mgnify:CR=1 FL=1|tara:strand:- start:814 stop:1791 length:978 start_codon:yes stop_codon:yes gene_type:complete
MAVSTFKYATSTDLQRVYSRIGDYDTKAPVYNFVSTGVNHFYKAYNTGKIDQLYFNGIEGTAVTDDPNANYEYRYSPTVDSVEVYIDTDNPNDIQIEAGVDFQTLIDDVLENASQEINTLLDARYPIPIPKAFLYSSDPANDTPQYDPIIIRTTCYLAIANLMRSQDPLSEEADKFYSLITNAENTGLIDEVNAGKRKLNFEIDATDKSGNIIEVTRTGTMHLVETYGSYSGKLYDRIQIICTTLGVYGVAKVTIKTFDGDKLYGNENTGIEITGGLQHISGGIYARFEGNSMAVDDRWDIEVRSSALSETNAPIKEINIRRGWG